LPYRNMVAQASLLVLLGKNVEKAFLNLLKKTKLTLITKISKLVAPH